MYRAVVTAVAAAASSASALVVNGGFEQPNLGFATVQPGQTYGNWTNAGPGSIEFVQAVPSGNLPGLEFSAYEGAYWIDLVGTGAPSAIYQDVQTTPGALYQISFAMAGNVWGPPMQMNMSALWNGQVMGSWSHLAQGNNGANMGWTVHSFTAVGTGLDRLTFQATSGGNARGPAIDDVQMVLVPGPAAGAILACGGLITAARRRRS